MGVIVCVHWGKISPQRVLACDHNIYYCCIMALINYIIGIPVRASRGYYYSVALFSST